MSSIDQRIAGPKSEHRRALGRRRRRFRKHPQTAIPLNDSASITCVAKTVRGNVFSGRTAAKIAARNTTRRTGVLTHAYKCDVCRRYHVGKPHQSDPVTPRSDQQPELSAEE